MREQAEAAAKEIIVYLNKRYEGQPFYDSTFVKRFAGIIEKHVGEKKAQ